MSKRVLSYRVFEGRLTRKRGTQKRAEKGGLEGVRSPFTINRPLRENPGMSKGSSVGRWEEMHKNQA